MNPRYLFDTDTCIYWLKGDAGIEKRVARVGLEHIGVSSITLCELYYGAFKSERRRTNLQVVDDLAGRMTVVSADRRAAPLFGEMKAELEKEGRPLDDADLLIGAVALACGAALVTNNAGHFKRIPGLAVETWNSKN